MGVLVKLLQEFIDIIIYYTDDKYTLIELEDMFENACFKTRGKRKKLKYVLKFGTD